MSTVTALEEKIREATAPEKADIGEVLRRIGEVLDRSIEGAAIEGNAKSIDLSRIDFKALAARFEASKTKNLDIERLKAAIRAQLDRLIAANETRADLREKFEALIEAYNTGSAQIAELFVALVEFTQTLSEEEARHVRENLSEEELVVFDLLTRPGPELSSAERDERRERRRGGLHAGRAPGGGGRNGGPGRLRIESLSARSGPAPRLPCARRSSSLLAPGQRAPHRSISLDHAPGEHHAQRPNVREAPLGGGGSLLVPRGAAPAQSSLPPDRSVCEVPLCLGTSDVPLTGSPSAVTTG